MKTIKYIILILIMSFISAEAWFSLSMNHGVPAPPNIIAKVIGADGENAYDALIAEMFIISIAIYSIVFVMVRKQLRK